MNKGSKHSVIGLTQDELKHAVLDSDQSTANSSIQDKLNNCDLSQPAIELINEQDLKAVLDISSGINSKYGIQSKNGLLKKVIAGVVVLLGILAGILFGVDQKDDRIVDEKVHHQKDAEVIVHQEVERKIPDGKNTKEVIPVLNKDKELTITRKEIENIDQSSNDSIEESTPIENPVKDEIKEGLEEKEVSEKPVIESKPKVQYVFKADKAPRRVLGVIVSSTLDNKFKGDSYSVSDLVRYQGGHEHLQDDIFELLKDEIKDTDVPKSSSTVVFNFEVSSRGKIKDVSVQSRVAPELEALIVQKVKTLSRWNKGAKRVAMTYSVFVTFK